MRPDNPGRGIRLMIMAIGFFAFQDGISKHLAAHYPVVFFVMIRYWAFAVFVLIVSARKAGGVRAAARTKLPWVQVARGLLLAAEILVIVWCFDVLGLAATHALFALHPLIATLLAVPLLGERIGWRRATAIAVGFCGVLLIVRPGGAVFHPAALVALVAAASFGLYSVLTRMATRADGSSAPAFFYTGVVGAVAMTLVGPFYAVSMTWPDIGWLGVLCVTGMCGHYCMINALDSTEAVRVQPFTYLQVVLTTIIGWAVFAEVIEPWMLAGIALIVGAGLYSIWREARLARGVGLTV